VLTSYCSYAIIVLSKERGTKMFKKYGYHIVSIILLLAWTFCIASDNQSLKNLILYIITATTVVVMIYIDKKY